nr:hypothetical protein [Tanacetum cinerariifolium]
MKPTLILLAISWEIISTGLTDDQLRIEYEKICRAVDLATAKDQHRHLKRSGETLESLESKKLKSSHSTSQPAELQETTYVSAGATIAAGDLIPAVTSVFAGFSISAGSFISADTSIAAGVSTTAGAFESASEVSVPIIELLDSPPKDTSLPLDLKTKELDKPLRKSSRKKSISRKRTLPSPSKPKSDALPFDEDNPEAAFKRYLGQASDDDEPAEPVSLALVSNITTWEIIPTKFGHGEIYVITRADGTVKRFSTLMELMYWAGRADLIVLYGLVLDKYKTKKATGSVADLELEILCHSCYSFDSISFKSIELYCLILAFQIFWVIDYELVDVLSVEPRAYTFKKKSLITTGIMLELNGGRCYQPATCQVEEHDEVKEAGDEGAGGSFDAYRSISRGD